MLLVLIPMQGLQGVPGPKVRKGHMADAVGGTCFRDLADPSP